MGKVVIPTKFNKTGKRVLTTPLDEKKICAPAYRLYSKAVHTAKAEWKCKLDSANRTYVESMAHWIASYVAKDSTPVTEKYRIAKFLAEQSLAAGSLQRWSIQLGDIPEFSGAEEEAWEACVTASRKADAERDAAIAKARTDCDDMKRTLSREVSNHIHHQYHQEDTH